MPKIINAEFERASSPLRQAFRTLLNMWIELLSALCLVLIIEGMMPFLSPRRWRSALSALASVSDKHARLIGLSSMLVGTILLAIVR